MWYTLNLIMGTDFYNNSINSDNYHSWFNCLLAIYYWEISEEFSNIWFIVIEYNAILLYDVVKSKIVCK